MIDKRIFKEYLDKDISYVGGKSMAEIETKASKIYKLSSNENPIGASPLAIEAIKKASNSLHIYPDRTDIRLREALVSYYKAPHLQAENFLCSNSGSDVLDMICRAFLTESANGIICTPCFSPYQMFSTWYGSKIIDVPLQGKEFELNVNGIISAIDANTRLVFITSPNNPTGTYIPKVQLEDLLSKIPDHVIVVYDEVYFHFADAEDYTTGVDLIHSDNNLICLNSFSKTYGLAALRLGYAYGNAVIMNYVRNLAKPFIINQLAIDGGIAALADVDFVDETVSIVQQEKYYIYKELDKLGIQYWKTQANFILIKPPIADTLFVDKLLEYGVMARPVANFGAPGLVRVSIGTHEANEAYIYAITQIVGT